MYVGGETIELKSDQTFEYNWVTGLVSGKTIGSWKKEENKIILNSELQPLREFENYELLKRDSKNSDSISIKLVDPESYPLPFAACVLKNDTTVIAWSNTNNKGEAKLPRIFADSLIIQWLGYKTIRHPIEKTVSHYEFKMQTVIEYYEYFTNDIWTYRNGKLYPPTGKPRYLKDFFKRLK